MTNPRNPGRAFTLAICAAVQCGGATGQEHPGAAMKTMEIRRLTGAAPVIDGRLDEAVWESATVVDDLHQVEPLEYLAPSDPTRILVFYDEEALYVGARMPQTVDVLGRVLRQGQEFWGDDIFSVVVDTFNDKRNGYRFQVNPNGVRMEAIYENTSSTNWDWSGIWRAAATEDGGGWTAEMAIPFKTLSFNPDNDTWGINFMRDIGRIDEMSGWVSRNNDTNPGIAGEAVGFTDLQLGRGLDVVPSLVLEGHRSVTPETSDYGADPSLDVYYKVTPSLNASLTLNTDFSATEVDDRQVEFTRFSLFFPKETGFLLARLRHLPVRTDRIHRQFRGRPGLHFLAPRLGEWATVLLPPHRAEPGRPSGGSDPWRQAGRTCRPLERRRARHTPR